MPSLNPEYGKTPGQEGLLKKHKEIYTAFDENLFIMNLIYAVSMITECAKAHNVKIIFATWCGETLYTLDKIGAQNCRNLISFITLISRVPISIKLNCPILLNRIKIAISCFKFQGGF